MKTQKKVRCYTDEYKENNVQEFVIDKEFAPRPVYYEIPVEEPIRDTRVRRILNRITSIKTPNGTSKVYKVHISGEILILWISPDCTWLDRDSETVIQSIKWIYKLRS